MSEVMRPVVLLDAEGGIRCGMFCAGDNWKQFVRADDAHVAIFPDGKPPKRGKHRVNLETGQVIEISTREYVERTPGEVLPILEEATEA